MNKMAPKIIREEPYDICIRGPNGDNSCVRGSRRDCYLYTTYGNPDNCRYISGNDNNISQEVNGEGI